MDTGRNVGRPSVRDVVTTLAALVACLGFAWFIHNGVIAAMLTILLLGLFVARWIWRGRYQ
jgi:hypothetical protein